MSPDEQFVDQMTKESEIPTASEAPPHPEIAEEEDQGTEVVPSEPIDASLSEDEVDEATSYENQTVEELKAESDKRELTVTGTGSNGNVLHEDYVKALEADDAKNQE